MAIEIPAWFDVNTYMANKLIQLQNTEPDANWTAKSLDEAFAANGYVGEEGAYKHFLAYGADEEVSPNADFDAGAYYISKAAQFYNVKPSEVTESQVEAMVKAFDDAGLNAWTHYQLYGTSEGVNPSNDFDTSAYMDAKLAQMRVSDPDYTMADLLAAFDAAGISALEHYFMYGKTEGITPTAVSGDEVIPAEPQPDPGVPGETFNLTADQDILTGTTGDDVFYAREFDGVNTLQSGDVVDGGSGKDTLHADVSAGSSFGHILNTVTPELKDVEIVKFRSQQATDSHDGVQQGANIDAERISGMTELWSSDSRADLTVEDVRIDSNQMTVGFQNADSGDVDYTVLFDNQHLKADTATTSGELVLQLIDTVGALPADQGGHADALYDNPYTGFQFQLNGTTYTVNFDAYNHTTDETPSYEELAAQIQAAIDADPTLSGLGLKVETGEQFNAVVGIGDHKGATVQGTEIVISSSDGALNGGNWLASNGLPETNSTSATMGSSAETTCPLISTDIALDNVGRVEWNDVTTCLPNNEQFGDNAGDMVVGGMGETSYVGVQRFDVKVDGGSWLSSLSSTNNALRMVTVTNADLNGDGKIGTDTATYNGRPAADKGNLFIGEGDRVDSTAVAYSVFEGRDGLLSTFDPLDGQAGLVDVKVFDASAMTGKANIAANISADSSAKYLGDTDTVTGAANAAPSGDFSYSFGSNDDTLNMMVDGQVAADNDFTLDINMGEGNNSVGITLDGSSPNWDHDQHFLNNVTVTTGSGNDVINAAGGHVAINAGAGNDMVYSDNSGVFAGGINGVGAVFALNTLRVAAARMVQGGANGIVPLENDFASKNVSFAETDAAMASATTYLEVTVTYKGVTATYQISKSADAKGKVAYTDAEINQLIMDAVNKGTTEDGKDSVLDGLLSAKEGAGHSLLLISKVDGQTSLDDLSIDFTAWYGAAKSGDTDAKGITLESVDDMAVSHQGGDYPAENGVNLNDWYSSDKANGHTGYAYTDNNGVIEKLDGDNGIEHSDNIINLGDGNDLAVLGTGANSNDTVVINAGHNGDNTIVNFDLGDGPGRDMLDVKAIFGATIPTVAAPGSGTAAASAANVFFLDASLLKDKTISAANVDAYLETAHNNVSHNNTLIMVHNGNAAAATFTIYKATAGATAGVWTVEEMSTLTFADFIKDDGSKGNTVADFIASVNAEVFDTAFRLNNGDDPLDARYVPVTAGETVDGLLGQIFQGAADAFNSTASTMLNGDAAEIALINVFNNGTMGKYDGTTHGTATISTVTLANVDNTVSIDGGHANNELYGWNGGSAADAFTIGTTYAKAIHAGAGDDSVTFAAGAVITNATFDGGEGTDTLTVNTALTFAAGQIEGFEALSLAANVTATMASADYAQFTGITAGAASTITFNDAAQDVVLLGAANLSYKLADAANSVSAQQNAAQGLTITTGAKADTIDLTNSAEIDTINLTANTEGTDAISGFVAGATKGDVLNLSAYSTSATAEAAYATFTDIATAGVDLSNKVVLLDSDTYADAAALKAIIADAAAANKLELGDNESGFILTTSDVDAAAGTMNVYFAENGATAGQGDLTVTLIGTVDVSATNGLVAGNFDF